MTTTEKGRPAAEGPTARRPLHAGDRVRVRSEADILATLDADGRLDGLPFMPEMLKFAGTELPVFKVAHKTCDMINKTGTTRSLERTVHLTGARCDGSAHGGCQAGCLLFWREDWLETADGVPLRTRDTPPATPVVTRQTLDDDTVRGVDEKGRTLYRCAATELVNASSTLSAFDIGQYVTDVRSGNVAVPKVLQGFAITLFNKFQQLSRRLPRRLRIADGAFYPFYEGTGPSPRSEPMNLRPGELVEVKSKEEIMATLGPDKRNRGLWFDAEMLPYCGRRGRVLKYVRTIIDEPTGRMLKLGDCVVIDQIDCAGQFNRFCPRSDYIYWREVWLRRVPEAPADVGSGPAAVPD